MKALVYDTFQGPLIVQDVPVPKPALHGAIIKVKATGLCRSDWHGWMGHDAEINLPHVPGHELAGIVEEVGSDVKAYKKGDRVTVPFVCGCGACRECQSGNQQVCDNQTQPGFTHWGSFAEYVEIKNADINLVYLPDDLSFEAAASLGCRFITAYRGIVDQAKLQHNQFVAVHGCGGVGLSAIKIAKAIGATVIAIDINEDTLQLAKSIGATYVLNGNTDQDLIASIKKISDGGVHVSVDALGSQATCFNSISNLRKRGKHIQIGLMTGDHQHPNIPMDLVVANELEILGSHGMQAHKYPEMLELIRHSDMKLEDIITQRVTLEEASHILPKMNSFGHKGIIVIDSF